MEETLDLERARLLLHFADSRELDEFLAKSRERGFRLRLSERLEEGTEFEVVLICARRSLVFPTRVERIFRSGADRFGTVLGVLDWSAAGAQAGAAPEPEPDEESAAPATDGDEVEARRRATRGGTSAFFDIQKLNPTQRILLASKADRQERLILLRDTSPPVVMALLSNPRIDPNEVLEIVKNPQAASGVLQRVAQDRRFSGNYDIQLALVRNAKTPSPLALRLLELLRTSDLRDLAKSQNLRENVRKGALRVYLRRSS